MNTRNIRFRSNRVRDILALFHAELDGLYDASEVSAFGEMLFEAFLGWNRVKLLSGKELTIDQSDLLRFHWALEDLKRWRPIQHIIGYVDFYGCRIEVNPDVLIPRPETEEMVQWTVGQGFRRRVLDLCTGSGCIALALKRAFPAAELTAVDLSPRALDVARRNGVRNGAEVDWRQADVLRWHSEGKWDLIVSNPPYVCESERRGMRRNVLDYEPDGALFVPDGDALCFYRALARIAHDGLAEGGLVVAEVNEAFADGVAGLMLEAGFLPRVHSDFRGKPRWVSAGV